MGWTLVYDGLLIWFRCLGGEHFDFALRSVRDGEGGLNRWFVDSFCN